MPAATTSDRVRREISRWNAYQRERFPLIAHAPLVAAFSGSAVSFASMLGGAGERPAPRSFAVAFVISLLFFLQLRIADEFKDAVEDARHRPYRPVPRGLVHLRELGRIGVVAAALQGALAWWLDPALLLWLLLPWTWFTLMSREFFAAAWLRRRPVAYLASHMAILPLIDLFATACAWRVAGPDAPGGLIWFLLASYANGVVIEVGRKIRVPADEEPGVDTYSALWGTGFATRVWLAAIAVTGALAWSAARETGTAVPTLGMVLVMVACCALAARRFRAAPVRGQGQLIERASAAWTLAMYLSLGLLPVVARSW